MSADIFGRRLHADVGALLQRTVIQWRRPGIVVDNKRPAAMRGSGDRGKVGHFERLRTGCLDQYRPGVGLEQLADTGADQGIEIGRLYAVAWEQSVAEISCRAISIVADQEMIAGLQHREPGRGDA